MKQTKGFPTVEEAEAQLADAARAHDEFFAALDRGEIPGTALDARRVRENLDFAQRILVGAQRRAKAEVEIERQEALVEARTQLRAAFDTAVPEISGLTTILSDTLQALRAAATTHDSKAGPLLHRIGELRPAGESLAQDTSLRAFELIELIRVALASGLDGIVLDAVHHWERPWLLGLKSGPVAEAERLEEAARRLKESKSSAKRK